MRAIGNPWLRMMRARWVASIAAVAWASLLGWYWWDLLPVEPEATYVVKQGEVFEGLSPAGEMMFSRTDGLRTASGGALRFGPVEFRSLPAGEVVRTAFEETDQVAPHFRTRDGRTVIRRNDAFWLATLSGELLHELPGLPGQVVPFSMLKGNRLLWQDDKEVALYDVDERRIITRLQQVAGADWHVFSSTDAIAAVITHKVVPVGGRQAVFHLLDLATGAIDARFSEIAPGMTLYPSPDDRFVAGIDGQSITVFDRVTAKRLWSVVIGRSAILRYEQNGEVLAVDGVNHSGDLEVSRWRMADGRPLHVANANARDWASRNPLEGTVYAVDFVRREKPAWERRLGEVLQAIARGLGYRSSWSADEERNILFDVSRNRPVAVLPHGWMEPLVTPDGKGLLVWSDDGEETLRYFQLPPRRSWRWLFQWAIGPAAVVLALVWIRGRRRNRGDLNPNLTPVETV